MKNKKIIIIGIGIITLLLVVGVSFAIFSFSKYGNNQQLVLGDIYMHYNETNQLMIDNAVPTSTYDPNKYFEFTIDGKNTYSKKDIYFDIVLSRGDNHETRNTRIDDKFLMFRLVEVVDGEENVIINKISLAGIVDNRIYVNTIPKNTLTQINKKYRLYMWIDNSVRIGKVGTNSTTQIDYDFDTWNNDVFASIKVNVSGDFIEKTIDFSKLFRGILNAKASTTIIDDDGTIYLSGPNEVTSSGGESSGEATSEASKEASNEATGEASNESSGESTKNTQDAVDYNYVWYSGKLWRITAVYPDGTMKMITDDAITVMSYNGYNSVNFYIDDENKSYIYQWLNEDFLDTLYNYENIIVTDSKWYSLTTTRVSTKIAEGASGVTTTTSPVGLLNSYEYYMSYKNTSASKGYLNIGYNWWLLNLYSTWNVWYVSHNGSANNLNVTNTMPVSSVRPSINLKSGIQLSGGLGTKTDPYTIAEDKEEVTAGTTLLNTRSSGEYVKFNNELYRIVSIENNITKINKNDYVRDTSNNVLTKKFSTGVTYGGGTTDDYLDYYLNNAWYNALDSTFKNMLVKSTYYIPTVSSGSSYKKAICATASNTVTTKDCEKTTSTWTGLVGLPRYGEMFASQQGSDYSSSKEMWLMNPYDTSDVWIVSVVSTGFGRNSPANASGGRPSINLKSSIKITGGSGTKYDPFEISE